MVDSNFILVVQYLPYLFLCLIVICEDDDSSIHRQKWLWAVLFSCRNYKKNNPHSDNSDYKIDQIRSEEMIMFSTNMFLTVLQISTIDVFSSRLNLSMSSHWFLSVLTKRKQEKDLISVLSWRCESMWTLAVHLSQFNHVDVERYQKMNFSIVSTEAAF